MSRDDTASAHLTKALLKCGTAAGPFFVTAFLIQGAARHDYNPLRHPVSSLALGPGGWVQSVNFIATGGLYLAASVGLARLVDDRPMQTRVGPALIGAAATGLVGAGVFLTDPVSGYPPGTPDSPAGYSRSGALHDLLSIPTFLGLPGAAWVYARRFRGYGQRSWARYSGVSAAGMLVMVAVASAGFNQVPRLVDLGGFFQRASITTGFAWLTALLIRSVRTQRGVEPR